jgi:hypothetical protein
VQTVWPSTVVQDGDKEILLYLPAGTVGKHRTGERGGPHDRMLLKWDGGHADMTWKGTNVLRFYRFGDPFSLWLAFDAATWVLVWRYINLEDPWLRTAIGFDSRDVYLDLVAGPDGDDWHWKDEDELAWVVEQGRIDARAPSRSERTASARSRPSARWARSTDGERGGRIRAGRCRPFVSDGASTSPRGRGP